MSKHDCGCGSKKIIIQCGPSGGDVTPVTPTTRYSCINGQCIPDPNGAYASLAACQEACRIAPPQRYSCINGQCVADPNGAYPSLAACQEACRETTQPPERCRTALVIIHSVRVTNDGESGDAEWTLSFDVNGQVQTWNNPNTNDGDPPYGIGFNFTVPIPNVTSTITIRVGGTEEDGGLFDPNDPLPSLVRTYGQAQNWGIGFHSESISDDEFAYTVNYEIQCVDFTTKAVVSRTELITRVRTLAEQHPSEKTRERIKGLSDSQIFTIYLKKLAKRSWSLTQVSEDTVLFEGRGAQRSPIAYFRPIKVQEPKRKS